MIQVIDKSFGFDTAVEEAQRAINAAHVEAESTENGIGLVKLMGRYSGKLFLVIDIILFFQSHKRMIRQAFYLDLTSVVYFSKFEFQPFTELYGIAGVGFIAMYATLASRDVDCCLIPESPFYLEGKGGLFEFIEKRLKEFGHMVIVIAEGAGQDLLSEGMDGQDASGNKLLKDVGLWMSQRIKVPPLHWIILVKCNLIFVLGCAVYENILSSNEVHDSTITCIHQNLIMKKPSFFFLTSISQKNAKSSGVPEMKQKWITCRLFIFFCVEKPDG